MDKIIEWLDAKWKAALLIVGGLIALLWWSNKTAVKSYKETRDEDANRRKSDALDAAALASRLDPDDVARRMSENKWYRD